MRLVCWHDSHIVCHLGNEGIHGHENAKHSGCRPARYVGGLRYLCSLGDALGGNSDLAECIVINIINILTMAFWNNNDMSRIVDPLFRRNECDNRVGLQDDVIFLLVLGFVAREPIAEWADVIVWCMMHRRL